jgi:two-component system, NarL family, nitrate/nitrite response regulator NarL
MPDALRLVIADDHPLFRDGLRRALSRDEGLRIVGEAADGQRALELIRAQAPDVAVLDIGLPGLDGCSVARQVREERLVVELVFLTVCDEVEVFERALEWDVKGYLLKDATPDEIVRCVRAVASGRNFVNPSMTTYLVQRTRRIERFTRTVPGLAQLTAQERAILRRIAFHETSKEIAAAIGISPKTVDAHRASICLKLGLHGTYALTRFTALHRDAL